MDVWIAFNTIDLGILLKKVEYVSIRGIALQWITIYSNNGKQ